VEINIKRKKSVSNMGNIASRSANNPSDSSWWCLRSPAVDVFNIAASDDVEKLHSLPDRALFVSQKHRWRHTFAYVSNNFLLIFYCNKLIICVFIIFSILISVFLISVLCVLYIMKIFIIFMRKNE
jgi:hypothetical protein